MKASVAVVLLVLSLALTACRSPASKINNLSTGMTKAQVIELLGAPRDTTAIGDKEVLLYKLTRYRPPLKVPLHEEYQVMLLNGQVFAFGKPRDLARSLPKPKDEQTINYNVHSTTTNTIIRK